MNDIRRKLPQPLEERKAMIWDHIEIPVPVNWEVLSFSKSRERGRLLFADRKAYRLEISWQRGPLTLSPAFLKDYLAKLKGDADVGKSIDTAGWVGLELRLNGSVRRHFLRVFPEETVLLEAVFIGPVASSENEILEGLSYSNKQCSSGMRMHAFGLDLLIPHAMEIQDCSVRPAFTRMSFSEVGTDEPSLAFERRGMVSSWMTMEVPEWLKQMAGEFGCITGLKEFDESGHRGARASVVKPRRWNRFWTRKSERSGTVSAWICPTDGRLYSGVSFAVHTDGDKPANLRCCPSHQETFV